MLGQYEQVQPGLGGVIATLMVDEARSRREDRRTALTAEIDDAKADRTERGRGQHYGLTIGLFAIAVGGAAAMTGHDVAGATIGGSGAIGLVTVFVTGQVLQTVRAFNTIRPKRAGPPDPDRRNAPPGDGPPIVADQ